MKKFALRIGRVFLVIAFVVVFSVSTSSQSSQPTVKLQETLALLQKQNVYLMERIEELQTRLQKHVKDSRDQQELVAGATLFWVDDFEVRITALEAGRSK